MDRLELMWALLLVASEKTVYFIFILSRECLVCSIVFHLSNFGMDWSVSTFDKIVDERKYKMTVLINEYGFWQWSSWLRKSVSAKAGEFQGRIWCPDMVIVSLLFVVLTLKDFLSREFLCTQVNSWFCFWKNKFWRQGLEQFINAYIVYFVFFGRMNSSFRNCW